MQDSGSAINIYIPPELFVLDKEIFPFLERLMKETGDILDRVVNQVIRDKEFVASGELLDSVFSRVENLGSIDQIQVSVGSNLIQGHVGEFGRLAGEMPPIEAIEKWMQYKNLTTGNDKVDRSIAYLIARKIGNEGIEARKIFSIALDRATPEINELWQTEIALMTAQLSSHG